MYRTTWAKDLICGYSGIKVSAEHCLKHNTTHITLADAVINVGISLLLNSIQKKTFETQCLVLMMCQQSSHQVGIMRLSLVMHVFSCQR